MSEDISFEVAKKLFKNQDRETIEKFAIQFSEIIMRYNCAIREVRTKIEVLNDEFQMTNRRNPIDTIKSRVKNPRSIVEKAQRKGYDLTIEAITENMHDIAGIRVICPFIEDIYNVAQMIGAQDDLRVISVDDYIANPKPNGYRSYHMVVEVPIFLSTGKLLVKVEIQIRTIAMDFWAALEHQIHYKKFDDESRIEQEIVDELKECADTIYSTDVKMENIRLRLEKIASDDKKRK